MSVNKTEIFMVEYMYMLNGSCDIAFYREKIYPLLSQTKSTEERVALISQHPTCFVLPDSMALIKSSSIKNTGGK
jgi:hypothetical protein